MKESNYQTKLIKKLYSLFPGCVVLKNDPGYIQGIPDLLVLFNDRWGMLEVKISNSAHNQPNQEYWIGYLNSLSFASFINPEIEDEVLSELQSAFGFSG